MRRTKIVCTLGPNCQDEQTLEKMIRNGMNVARLNFSHQEHSFHKQNIETLKSIRNRLQIPLAIMLDTKGPEIRTGKIKDGTVLEAGSKFILTAKQLIGDSKICSVSLPSLYKNLASGDKILIDDGKIMLSVSEISDTDIICTVITGGMLGSTRGINIPSVDIDMPFLSEKDCDDLLFGIENDIDIVAASFVRSAEDVRVMRDFLWKNGGESIKIIAKIESQSGIENFEKILAAADGIMVARGDMGVELPYELLPGIQKRLISQSFRSGKTVITATQMLESMIDNSTPTRAEISDVANAVFDSSSAVMLSGETAIGIDPPKVVSVMSKICERAETDAFKMNMYKNLGSYIEQTSRTNAICDATTAAAADINADAIIAVTKDGETARLMSKYRPEIPIIGATNSEKTYRQLSLNWGVTPLLTETQNSTDRLFRHIVERAKSVGLLRRGNRAVITAGMPLGVSGSTNTLKIITVE